MVEESKVMFQYEPHVGIDLGTTNSCIYLWNPDTQDAEVIANFLGENTTPSWVAYGERGDPSELRIGRPAAGKKNWCYDVKRVIGEKWSDLNKGGRRGFREFQRKLPYTISKADPDRVNVEAFMYDR